MYTWDEFRPENPAETLWDVIVIGTGMGGGTAGYALAKSGLRVLFIEKGLPPEGQTEAPRWRRLMALISTKSREATRRSAGRWPHKIAIRNGKRCFHFYPPLGMGPGGSTAIYGACLERFRRADFATKDVTPFSKGLLPNDWPVDYDEFRRYYAAAEDLYGVCGTHDPLDSDDTSIIRTPPPPSNRDHELYLSLQSLGLSPYRLHVGIEYKPGCTECQGVRCSSECKADASSRTLKRALSEYGAKVLFGCTAENIEMSASAAKTVKASVDGKSLKLQARVFVVAAGALFTPLLLLKSRSKQWPAGIGNSRDLVGRGLMFHVSDFFALWPANIASDYGPIKTIGSRAFYMVDGQKLGGLQSVGLRVSADQVSSFLDDCMQLVGLGNLPLAGLALRGIAAIGARFFSKAALFATIVEDFPYYYNRVLWDEVSQSGLCIEYRKPQELIDRTDRMRKLVKQALAPHQPFLLSLVNNINFGHPCGTCRFGADPATSVLDRDNKVHDTQNVFVVDASFFPSSAGVNPSLTIAANALRVANVIAANKAQN